MERISSSDGGERAAVTAAAAAAMAVRGAMTGETASALRLMSRCRTTNAVLYYTRIAVAQRYAEQGSLPKSPCKISARPDRALKGLGGGHFVTDGWENGVR